MNAYTRVLLVVGLGVLATAPMFSQQSGSQQSAAAGAIPAGKHDARSDSYYNFAMAHLYGELASAYGNRGEYVNKAIDFYKEAMKLDPDASYIGEELADLYVQTQQLERATAQANELIKANPNNANAHKVLARIYSRQIGDPDQGQAKIDQAMLKAAIGEYAKIVEIDPKDVESLSMLARLYRVSHDDANAEKVYRQLIVADPNGDDALTGLAAVYADRGDLPAAIDLLKQAAERNPDPRTVTALAEMYEQNKDYGKAADTWLQALPLTNDNSQVRKHLAASLLAANRADEALKVFQDLAQEDPKNLEMQLQLMELLERKGDFVGAHAALGKAQAISNAPQVRIAEAELLEAEGNGPKAITVLEGVLTETKKAQYSDAERGLRIQVTELLARMLRGANRIPDAVAAFRQIAELNPPAAPRVEVEIIETMMAARDFKAARQAADAAVKKFPGERLVALEHASVLANTGQYDAAITELRAMPNAAKDRDTQIQIAQIQEKAKRFADERKSLDAAEALSTSGQEKQAITFMRGAMFEREKDFDAAEQQFRTVLSGDPSNAGAMNYLGYMLADRNVKLDEAHKLIQKALELDPGNGAYLDSLGWV
ncbi:MAG TPA: tetratricopeptide repeat protein, partial [Bryobacteraceae bacterium]|nr:tetratricopeptide repeat protein [Bryobacteraceae bacterium]